MRNLAANIRYAIRQFRLSPVFTAAAIITLALGIGGTTAIFTLMDAIMLRSLPVSDPGRLYRVGDGSDCCVEGGPVAIQRTAARGRRGSTTSALRIRYRDLLFRTGSARLRRADVHTG